MATLVAHRRGRRTSLLFGLTCHMPAQHTVTEIEQIEDALRGNQHKIVKRGGEGRWGL